MVEHMKAGQAAEAVGIRQRTSAEEEIDMVKHRWSYGTLQWTKP